MARDLPKPDGEFGFTPETSDDLSGTSSGPPITYSSSKSPWLALSVGGIGLVLLLVFVTQNLDSYRINVLFWHFSMSHGVSLLIAAVFGSIITFAVLGFRRVKARRASRR